MSSFKNTQITSPTNYNISNILYSEPIKGSIQGSVPISFMRVMIGTKNADKTSGKLLVSLPSNLYCFGVTENIDAKTNIVNGHGIACSLWDKEGPTKNQKDFTDTHNNIIEDCKRYILENKDKIEKYDLESSDLKKLNPLYWKKDKGQIIPGKGPTFYPKLIESKKTGKILTQFYDEQGNSIDPLELVNKPFTLVDAIVDYESIFIGTKPSMQIKLYEAIIKKKEAGMQSFLRRNVSTELKLEDNSSTKNRFSVEDNDDFEEKEDIKESPTHETKQENEIKDDEEDDQQKEEESKTVKKTVRKVVSVKRK
jgi:hypothetical protein